LFPFDRRPSANAKGLRYVSAARRVAQASPRLSGLRTSQSANHGNSGAARKPAGEPIRLVDSALPAAPPIRRRGRDAVEPMIARQGGSRRVAQRAGKRLHLFAPEQVARGSIVSAVGICRIEAAQTAPAKPAAAFLIQPKGVLKRGAPTYAEEFRAQRLQISEAGAANRDAGNFEKRLAAEAAVSGVEEGKKGARGFLYYRDSDIRADATREDSPPPKNLL
jgi:hypothetical protein